MRSKRSSMPWTPHNYQKTAVKFLLERASAALFLDPGLGKTSIVLAAIIILKRQGLLNKVLLIAPLRICHLVWPNEVKKWLDFNGLKVVVLHGRQKEKLLNEEADIYVINPEGIDWLLQIKKTKSKAGKTSVSLNLLNWKKLGFDTLVIDELTKFKHTNTNRFKAMKLILGTFARKWGLTGSPAASGLMDLFGQCYMLDQGRSLGRYITHYRNEYFDQSYDGFTWSLKEGSAEKIYARVAPLALRMGDELLDLPEIVNNVIEVELPDKARNIYDELQKDMISKIEEGFITAKNAAVASSKCRQVANGAVYVEPEVQALVKLPTTRKKWVALHNAKLDALEELIEELQGSPILIGYQFKHDIERLKSRFGVQFGRSGKQVPYIGGGVSMQQAKKFEAMWNNGELPYLFGHPTSMAHGLNLQGCGHHIGFFSSPWSYEEVSQFIRRVRRQGNKAQRVFVHNIIAKDTVDETVLQVTSQRHNTQKAFFEALKKFVNK